MKCHVVYVVTIRWNYLGTREYMFDSFHEAYESIRYVRNRHPHLKITCKSKRR